MLKWPCWWNQHALTSQIGEGSLGSNCGSVGTTMESSQTAPHLCSPNANTLTMFLESKYSVRFSMSLLERQCSDKVIVVMPNLLFSNACCFLHVWGLWLIPVSAWGFFTPIPVLINVLLLGSGFSLADLAGILVQVLGHIAHPRGLPQVSPACHHWVTSPLCSQLPELFVLPVLCSFLCVLPRSQR